MFMTGDDIELDLSALVLDHLDSPSDNERTNYNKYSTGGMSNNVM